MTCPKAQPGLGARVPNDGGATDRSRWSAVLYGLGETTLSQSELRVSQDSVGHKQSQDSGVTAFWVVAAATEVLSTPRKWPKGSGQWPFKRQSRPLAPRPTPPWAGRALLWVGAGPCQWERWGRQAGPADWSGGGMIHRLRCGCGRDGPAFPAGVHDLTRTTWSGLESPVHPSILRKSAFRGWIPVGNSRGGGC